MSMELLPSELSRGKFVGEIHVCYSWRVIRWVATLEDLIYVPVLFQHAQRRVYAVLVA